jgi:hypothetical protein
VHWLLVLSCRRFGDSEAEFIDAIMAPSPLPDEVKLSWESKGLLDKYKSRGYLPVVNISPSQHTQKDQASKHLLTKDFRKNCFSSSVDTVLSHLRNV